MVDWSKKIAIEHVVELKNPFQDMIDNENGGMMNPQSIKEAIKKRGNGNLDQEIPREEIL